MNRLIIKYPKRMLKLAKILKADAKNRKGLRFYYGSWGTVESDFDSHTCNYIPRTPGMNCNTRACAMGAAAISGAFRRQGLTHHFNRDGYIDFRWKGRHVDGIQAAEKLFGIDSYDAKYLFTMANVPGNGSGAAAEVAVAKQLERFVKENR